MAKRVVPGAKGSAGAAPVRVIVRVRPMLKTDVGQEVVNVVPKNKRSTNVGTVLELLNERANDEVVQYNFDSCYGQKLGQRDLFEKEVAPILKNVFKGLNTTVFAYGNTGAGKTHTMQGTSKQPGIIPRAVKKLLAEIDEREAALGIPKSKVYNASSPFQILMSYAQIYNEKVYDLLGEKDKELPIREDQKRNIFIAGLNEIPIASPQEFDKVYERGCNARSTASTKLNSTSSRSHAVLMLKVSHVDKDGRTYTGKVHLIDLAGSEDNRRSGNKGQRMVESGSINLSLFVLAKVVNALNANEKRIPYRDSKLTRLLQDSLGGNSRAIMVANIAPGSAYWAETTRTLNFATKSKNIVNVLEANITEKKKKPTPEASKKAKGGKKASMSPQETETSSHNRTLSQEEKLAQWRQKRKSAGATHPETPAAKRQAKDPKFSVTRVAAQVEAEVTSRLEAKFQQQLDAMKKHGQLLSPHLRKQRVLDTATQERLEALEAKLVEATRGPAAATAPSNNSNEFKIRTVAALRDETTARAEKAKDILLQAKALKSEGQLQAALRKYKAAQILIPDNSKLKSKILELEIQIEGECGDKENLYDVAAVRSSSASNVSAGSQVKQLYSQVNAEVKSLLEREIIDVLNQGNLSDLMGLQGVGKKRAQMILSHRVQGAKFRQITDLKECGFGDKLVKDFLKKNALERMDF